MLLLDEIEKAHLNVFDLYLQIFDAGRLTDAQGRTADFRRTIIVLTSNVGSRIATELFLKGKSEQLIEHMAKLNPLERLGTPEDIAGAVSFLAGPDGAWINGQVLRANGGMV